MMNLLMIFFFLTLGKYSFSQGFFKIFFKNSQKNAMTQKKWKPLVRTLKVEE